MVVHVNLMRHLHISIAMVWVLSKLKKDSADIDMAGVNAVFMGKWPGPIHEGNGEMQIILDSKSSQEQQDAIKKHNVWENTLNQWLQLFTCIIL